MDRKDGIIDKWRGKARIDLRHVRYEGEGDDVREIVCSSSTATSTVFAITASHPIDGHQFGLALNATEVINWPPKPYLEEAFGALEDYLKAHPDGDFCDSDDCKHNKREDRS